MAPPVGSVARHVEAIGHRRLVSGVVGLGEHTGEKGGEKTGPNPVDRGRPGSKRHLLVDGSGTPLAVALTGAQVHDSKVVERLIDGVEPVRSPGGGPGSGRVRFMPTRATTSPGAAKRSDGAG